MPVSTESGDEHNTVLPDEVGYLPAISLADLYSAILAARTSAGSAECVDTAKRLTAAGGVAENIYLPDRGIRGNSHKLIMDLKNLEIGVIGASSSSVCWEQAVAVEPVPYRTLTRAGEALWGSAARVSVRIAGSRMSWAVSHADGGVRCVPRRMRHLRNRDVSAD
jgi:hypothetical protein